MALESFYGGKPGVSPVIKARFKYIDTKDPAYIAKTNSGPQQLTKEEANWLNDAFGTTGYTENLWVQWVGNSGASLADVNISTINEQNPLNTSLAPFTMEECLKDISYTNVWYGELCIIDTDSKLNPNNGKIYRRTLKYGSSGASATGYAEYVGQIVGPSGGVPQFHIGSLDEERKKAVGTEGTYEGESSLSNKNWQYSYIESTNENLTSEIPDNFEKIAVLNANNENSANIQMVPGKETIKNNDNTETIKYHDNIRYTWCNVRRKLDGDNTEDAWIYLGFEIPYTTFEVTGVLEDFTYAGDLFENNSSNNHPFHKDYVFHIPRGARGIGPEEVFIVGKNGKNKPDELYDFDTIKYDSELDKYYIPENARLVNPNSTTEAQRPYKNKNTPVEYIDRTATYWVGKWTLYNPKTNKKNPVTGNMELEEPVEIYQYLGSYKDVDSITLSTDGLLKVTYTDGKTININDQIRIKWINSINIDTDEEDNLNYGNIKILYNTGTPVTKNLHLIKDANYDDETGQITFNYSGEVSKIVGPIEYISKMKVDNEGYLLYQYNTDDIDEDQWRNITDGSVASEEHDNRLRIKDIDQMHVTNYGQLEVLYRGDTTWSNLGQTNNIVNTGPVCILENSDPNSVNGIFSTRANALDQLMNSTYNDSTPYPKINGTTGTIKIEINGEEIDASGGLVGVKVSNSNTNEDSTTDNEGNTDNEGTNNEGDTNNEGGTNNEGTNNESDTTTNVDNSEDYYIALYWYDPNPSSDPKGWIYVGAIGSGIDQNYEVYISKKDEIVPNVNVENAAIHFQAISTDDFVASGQQEAIGFLPWETVENNTSNGDNTSDGDEIPDENENSSGGENSGGEGSDENNTSNEGESSDEGENSGGDEGSGETTGGDESGS